MRARHLQRQPFKTVGFLIRLFSDSSRQRPQSQARFITIGVSHYCEKARWGLDLLSDFIYTEDAHPPAFSSYCTVPASNDTGSAVPALLLLDETKEGQRFFMKSDVILRRFCKDILYPSEIENTVEQIEDDLSARLGPAVRLLCYHYMLHPDYLQYLGEMAACFYSKIERFLFQKMLPQSVQVDAFNEMIRSQQ